MNARAWTRVHGALTLFWAAMIAPTLLWWSKSVLWVALMSLWANIASHWSAMLAAKAERAAERK